MSGKKITSHKELEDALKSLLKQNVDQIEIPVTCPKCAEKFTSKSGSAKCPKCGADIDVIISDVQFQ